MPFAWLHPMAWRQLLANVAVHFGSGYSCVIPTSSRHWENLLILHINLWARLLQLLGCCWKLVYITVFTNFVGSIAYVPTVTASEPIATVTTTYPAIAILHRVDLFALRCEG